MERLFKCLECALDLGASARLLIGANDLVALLEIFLLAQVKLIGEVLIVMCNLRAKVAAARVDD